ncbi:uncharacterized protein LTHEOB_7118 [Lasiodiplodia theobromae]|uniref:Neurofilament heavy polypeptide n=1 Tax=Lasiodiplodia theobromae TaxID=45133 RepID=A0A5N5DP72_9PEZI|nr:uncharacterized protein LTHEOB_7118 [Lasiodiplodia theobromae]KAB2579603.1 Neurofilament heavy polypeptide [Lasiodiplodia theobromae]KAF4542864.1 hypothetical protein LTHEOB_7118 [Lasiodiplodia theobromae]
MSISDTTPPTTQAAKTTVSSTSLAAEDEEELRKLDQVFKRIRTNIPDAPYIITVPCAEPRYHHWSREQAESWCRNTPFDPSEERLQYMSFLYRDHADSCFVCRTEVDEERDRRAAMKTKSAPSGTSTPRSDVPKKKISLAAYSKSKQANGLPPKPGSSQEQSKKDTAVNESRGLPDKPVGAHKSAKRDDLSFAMSETEEEKPLTVKKNRSTPPPTKNSRNADNNGLPPLISPITSPNTTGLPPLLSPTLPDVIEAELEKLAERHKRNSSSTSISSEHKSGTPLLGPEIKANQSSTPSKTTSRAAEKRPPNSKADEPDHKLPTKHARVPSQTSASMAKPPQDKPRKLIVKLKYGRKRRQDVERCLKLPPGRKARQKEPELPHEDSQEPERIRKVDSSSRNKELPSKDGSRKSGLLSAMDGKDNKARHVAEKRPRAAEDSSVDAPPPKRPRAPSNLDLDKKPRTPVPPSTQSPSLPNKPSQKSQYLTPRKEAKSIGMIRTVSNDSNGVTSTPAQTADTPSDAKGPTSSINGRPGEAQIWTTHSRKLNELGRRLKHESQSLCDPRNQPSLKDRKRGAVMSVECILSYMAAYYASDYKSHLSHHPTDLNASWRTLFPLFRFFKNNCQEFPHLEGLRLQLGAIICARITTLVAQRPPQPGDSGDKNAFTTEKALSTMSEYIQNMTTLVAESRSKLPFEDLISNYPKTWNGRARGVDVESDPRSWEKLELGSLEGNYNLPLGPDTSPIQAVRMGIIFLNEWMNRENVDYKLQIKL